MVEVGLGIAIMPSSAVLAYAGTKRFVRRPLDEPWRDRSLRVYALRKSPRLRAVDALLADSRTLNAYRDSRYPGCRNSTYVPEQACA